MQAFALEYTHVVATYHSRRCSAVLKSRQREERIRRLAQHDRGGAFPYRWTMFVAVPRAAADQQNVLQLRMTIDDKVPVRRVLVLTYPGLQEWRTCQRGKAHREISASRPQSLRT